MKKAHYLLITLVLFLIISCKNVGQKTTITNLIDLDYVLLSGAHTGILDSIPVNKKVNIEINYPQVLDIEAGKQSGRIYITPNSQITISSNGDGLYYEGDFSKENNMLTNLTDAMSSQNAIMNLWDIAHVKEDDFLKSMARKKEKFDSIVKTVQTIDPKLKKWVDKRINALIAYEKMQYPHYYKILTQDTIELSENYENYLAEIDINDPDLLQFYEGQNIIKSILEMNVDFNEAGEQYYKILFDKVNRLVSNQRNKEYLLKEYLIINISNGAGIDYINDMLVTFSATNTNKAYQREVDVLVESWDDLRKGKSAPSFHGITADDKIVALEDLKGNNIYVDVWATWCQPCIREIPYLKELEHEYKDENIKFVSISIDRPKDKEKWKKFVKNKGLGGIQIFAKNEWKDELFTNYNIVGIPRFLLIDNKGKIVSANAPRPSNPKLKNILNTLFKK